MKTYSQFISEATSVDGIYTYRKLSSKSAEFLYEWMRDNEIPNPVPPSELHCTVVCSEVEIPGFEPDSTQVMLNPATYRIRLLNQALVVEFKSDCLEAQWQKAMNLGAKSKFPTFISHITLSYKIPEDFDYKEVKPPPTFLILDGEKIRPYVNGWASLNDLKENETDDTPKIYVPTSSLNIPRQEMPQITQTNIMEFLDWFESQGVVVQFLSMPVASLRSAQDTNQVNLNKVSLLLQHSNTVSNDKPMIVSKDNFIVDGQHRWVALLNKDPQQMIEAYRINLPIEQLLTFVKDFKHVFFSK